MDRGHRPTGQGRRGYQQGPNAGQRNDHDSFNRPSNWQGPQPNYYDRNDSRSTNQNQERDSFDNQEPMRNRGRNQAQNNYRSDNRQNRGNQQNDDDRYSGRGLEGHGGREQGQSFRGQQRQYGRGPRGQGGRRQQDQGFERAQFQDKREKYPQGNTNEDQSDRNQDGHGGGRQQRSQGYNDGREQFQDERAQYSQGNRNRDQSYSGRGLQGHGGKGLQGHFDREQQSQEYYEGEQFYDDCSKSAQQNRNQNQVNRGQQGPSNRGKKYQRGRGQQWQDERGQQDNGGIWQGGSQSSQMPNSGIMPNTAPPLYNIPPPVLGYPTQAPMVAFVMPPYYPMQPGQSLLPPPPQSTFNKPLPRSSSTFSVDSVGVKNMNKPRIRNNGERDQERTNRDDRFNEDQTNLGRSYSTTSINSVGSNDLRQPSGNKNQRGSNRMYRQDPINNVDENYQRGDMNRSSSIRNINVKHIVKKPAKQSSDDETSDEFKDVSDEEVELNPPFVENTKEPNNNGIIDLLSEVDYILEQKEPLTEKKQPVAIDKQKKTDSQSDVLDMQKKADDKQPVTADQQRVAADKKLARKPKEASSGPDVNAIFKFLVKNFEGKGTPEEIVRESGLFPVDYDAIGWFRKVRNRFHLLERNGIVDVFVFIKDATYCMDYIRNTSCSKVDCQRYHVCKDMLAGNCVRGVKCKFSHDTLDERNMRISKELGFDNIFTNVEICSILRVRYPHICPSWIGNSTCFDTRCIGLHLCPRYILGNCLEGDTCPMIHDRFSDHNKPIVECYYMEKWVESHFRKSLYMIRCRTAEGDETIEPIKANEVRGVNAAANSNSPSKRRLKSDKSREETDPSNDLVICDLVLMDKSCKKCKLIHGSLQLPYLWQVNLFGSWFTHQRSEDVEKTFCDNKDFSDRYHVIHNQMELKVVVIFKPSFKALVDIIGAECTTEATEARRLSTPSYKEGDENSASFKTQWRWYWEDDQGWHLFEPDTLQHTLEMKYLAKQSNYNYFRENYRFKYSVDFNAMVQHNIDTGNQQAINRVPLFVSSEDIKTKTIPKVLSPAPPIETPLPENWVPWDLAHPFELVRLAENSTDYQTVSDHFYKTLDIEKQRIVSVFRLQNHKLWGLFCKQEKFMEAELKRLGNDAPLNKPYLFHGTDNLDAVRGICINNFDNRVSGKNATMYGDGAYFARDAKYSHCYTKPPLRFMFMVTALIGQYTKGDKSYRRPPNKLGNDHELFDSCVDDVNNPSIYVVFDKNQYYPEFLIHYRNANDESSGDGLQMSSYTSYSGGSGNVTAANLTCASTVGSGLSYRCYPPWPTVYPVQQPLAYPEHSTPSHAGSQTSSQLPTYSAASTTQSTTSTAPLERKMTAAFMVAKLHKPDLSGALEAGLDDSLLIAGAMSEHANKSETVIEVSKLNDSLDLFRQDKKDEDLEKIMHMKITIQETKKEKSELHSNESTEKMVEKFVKSKPVPASRPKPTVPNNIKQSISSTDSSKPLVKETQLITGLKSGCVIQSEDAFKQVLQSWRLLENSSNQTNVNLEIADRSNTTKIEIPSKPKPSLKQKPQLTQKPSVHSEPVKLELQLKPVKQEVQHSPVPLVLKPDTSGGKEEQ